MARRLSLLLVTLALAYALLAGVRTVGDFDIGWQLATGRYILQHKSFPSVDVFSYTAAGERWMYPPFSGLVFYWSWLVGGFAAISWLSAAACVAAVAILLAAASQQNRMLAAALAVIAVPTIAFRTRPRADLFTTVLFAAVMAVLWRRVHGRPAQLWLLPVLMCAWANLHLGFPAGLVLCGLYAAAEGINWLTRAENWLVCSERLQRSIPWLAAAVLATLINPFGAGVYQTVLDHRIMYELEGHVGDWVAQPLSYAKLLEALDWVNPASGYWWMLAFSVLGLAAAVVVRSWGAVLFLAFGIWSSLRFLRFQAVLAMIAVAVLPDVFRSFGRWAGAIQFRGQTLRDQLAGRTPRLGAAVTIAVSLALVALVSVRAAGLVTQRHYLREPDTILFGTGASWWYPERAAEFVRHERLPGRILNDFNLGGYLAWTLGPEYANAIDGRCPPFGAGGIFEFSMLMAASPDGELWANFVNRWQVNTVIVTTGRYAGAGSTPLAALCASRSWRPVYLDGSGAVFIRNIASNQPLLDRLAVDCNKVRFAPPAAGSDADMYNFWVNTGNLLHVLGRRAEALEALERARHIFDADPQYYLIRGSVWQAQGNLGEAERNYRTSVALRPNEHSWYALGQVLAVQGRYNEAAVLLRRAAAASQFSHEIYRFLGDVLLAAGRPEEALRAFDQAASRDTYRGAAAPLGAGFRAGIQAGRARALAALHRP